MKLSFAKGFWGMTPYEGSIVGGLYVFVVCLMQLVFEVGHLQRATEYSSQAPFNWTTNSTDNITLIYIRLPQLTFAYYYSLLSLQIATVVLAVVLLVGLWFQHAWVILASAAWLALFDVAMVTLVSLLHLQMWTVGLTLSPLEWYGFVCRLLGDPFWLSFVITHGLQERSSVDSKRQTCVNVLNTGTKQRRIKLTEFDGSV